MKIKIFDEPYNDSEELELSINSWLLNDKISVVSFNTTLKVDYLVYSFVYYDVKELRKAKIDEINES